MNIVHRSKLEGESDESNGGEENQTDHQLVLHHPRISGEVVKSWNGANYSESLLSATQETPLFYPLSYLSLR